MRVLDIRTTEKGGHILTALANNGSPIISTAESVAQAGPFTCPECRSPVILKRGTWVIHHFAHKANSANCPRENESQQHALTKLAIYEAAKAEPAIKHVQMEFRTGHRIADVALMGVKRKIAVEIQLSPIPFGDILNRTFAHQDAGFSTMWVVDLNQKLSQVEQGTQYSVKAFQRDIHELCDRSLFVHREGLSFDVVHLMGYKYKTFKHFKVNRKPVHIFQTVANENSFVIPDENDRWWERVYGRKKPMPFGWRLTEDLTEETL